MGGIKKVFVPKQKKPSAETGRIKPNPNHTEALVAYQCAVPDENMEWLLIEVFKSRGYKKESEVFYADTSKRVIRFKRYLQRFPGSGVARSWRR